jgi:EmrB/QacA subfamily drug resistance transporter
MPLVGNTLHRAHHLGIPHSEGRHRGLVLATMSLATALAQFPTAAIVVALPVLHDELNASTAELQWTVTGYTLALSAFLIVGGRLADIYGRRAVLVGGAALFAAGSLIAAIAPSGAVLIAGLVIAGLGGAAMTPASLAIVLNAYRPSERGLPLGIWGGASALGQGFAPLIGGVLTGELGWEWIFWFQVAVAGVVALGGLAFAAESRDAEAERRIDVTGLTLAVASLTTLTLATIQAPVWGLASGPTLVLLGVAIALGIGFVIAERRVRNPLVDLGLFRHRNFSGAAIVLFIVNFALIAALFLMPLFLQEELGDSATESGLQLMTLIVGMAVGSPLGGPLAQRLGPLPPLVAGGGMIAVALFLLAGVDVSTTYADLWWPFLILGLGTGLTLTPMNLAAMNSIPTRLSGQAGGVFTTLSGLGISFGAAICGAVFNSRQISETVAIAQNKGVHLSDSQAQDLDGLLAGASDAMAALGKYSAEAQKAITDAVHEAFAIAIGAGLRLGAFLAIAGVIVALLLIRREVPADEVEAGATEPGSVASGSDAL